MSNKIKIDTTTNCTIVNLDHCLSIEKVSCALVFFFDKREITIMFETEEICNKVFEKIFIEWE